MRTLALCTALLSLPALGAGTAIALIPNYIQETAARYQLSATDLFAGGDAWPWLVWRDNTPLRLRDQATLIRYLQADPNIPFGLWRLRLADFPIGTPAALASNPRQQAELAARRALAYKQIAPRKAAPVARHAALPAAAAYSGRYQEHINSAATRHGVPSALIAAVIGAESNYVAGAVSPKGARGLMQVMPGTAASMGYNPDDMFKPSVAIDAGTRYLAIQLNRFKQVDLALAAYNAGPEAVAKYGNRIPPYRETQDYVKKILNNYHAAVPGVSP